ncbi:amino acid transporter ANT1-like [Pecten maximus]|uniref:amino acid transporter ANT1-like n=1 Tax=Pecten maximus TaxID=6579 RepID=UPI001458F33A|nr:amino acid transporter ANT1-like [Pecten maximus]
MPANSVELTSLNITDSHETCHNGFDYSSCEKTFKSDANISSEDKETKGEDTLTDFQGFMLLIPSYIGVGFLGLPYIVKILGLWGGSTGLFFYGMLNEVASLILVECTKRLSERFFIDFSIFMTYALVMPDLISLMNLFGKDILRQYVDINDNVSIVAISVLLLPIYLTRRMKLLSFVATAGNIVLILPVRDKMKTKKNFDGWNGVLGLVLVIVTCFHAFCGFYGYLKFGEMTKVNYLLNLPGDKCFFKELWI